MATPESFFGEHAPSHVLLVEDSPSDRLMTKLALEESGVPHVLHTVDTSADTLRFLRRQSPFETAPRPSLILLDLNLPGMDGRALLRRIKSDPELLSIPTVVLTTSKAPSDVRSAYARHANCYLRKATDFREFVKTMSAAMHFWCETITTPPPPDPVPALTVSRSATKHLLLVEDSSSDVLLFRAALAEVADHGFEVTHVDRITSALAELEQRHFHVIVSDLSLPDAHGVESIRLLASMGATAPIIALTGSYADVGESVLAAGADDFLPKNDLTGVRLTRILRHAIRRRQLQNDELQVQRIHTVGRLAASVAHDMNNLLAAIRLTTEMVPRSSTECSALAAEIVANVERGRALTRQLLSFGRRGDSQRTVSELNGAVTSAASLLARLLHRDVSMAIELTEESTAVLADIHQLEQAVINLGLNANDAMAAGGLLRISTRRVELSAEDVTALTVPLSPGTYLAVVVEDSGPGIPPDLFSHIFAPFFTTKNEHEGTGLGLATVREIAVLHCGSVMVENRDGGGAVFTLLIPPHERADSYERLARSYTPRSVMSVVSESGTPATHEVPAARRHLLVAEDDEAVARALSRVLSANGFVVTCVGSADEAWSLWKIRGREFDGVVTDLIMPGAMSVRELVERLRAGRPKLPVVFCSGYAGLANEEELALVEGTNFVSKPFDFSSLLSVLNRQFAMHA